MQPEVLKIKVLSSSTPPPKKKVYKENEKKENYFPCVIFEYLLYCAFWEMRNELDYTTAQWFHKIYSSLRKKLAYTYLAASPGVEVHGRI